MSNSIKNIILGILLIAVVYLGVKFYQHQTIPASEVVSPNIPIQHSDADGTVHTEVKAYSDADINYLNKYYQDIIAGLTKKLNAKQSDLNDITIINTETEDSFKPTFIDDTPLVKTIDSNLFFTGLKNKFDNIFNKPDSTEKIIYYKDKWLELHGNTNKDSTWHYTMNDVINIVGYEKKTGFLKSEIYVDVTTENPHTKIVGFSAMRIQPKIKSWGIGVSAGYVFDGSSIKPGISLGITKTFLRW
jgi:hypothetical protein